MKKLRSRAGGAVLLIMSIILTCGVKLIFPACPAHDDGTYMSCHWAEQAVFGIGIALCVISLIIIIGGEKTAAGASLAAIPLACITALMPEFLISLCKMPTMHCHTAMRPAVIVISALIAAAAAVNSAVMLRKRDNRK